MKLTTQQIECVEAFQTGQHLIIEAGAGTGKTSTLQAIAESSPHLRGLYIAFNKAIVVEASEKMPSNVTCATVHSLAYRSVGAKYRHRFQTKMSWVQLARALKVEPLRVQVGNLGERYLSASFLAAKASQTITRFCQSDRTVITKLDLPYIEGIDLPTGDGHRTYNNQAIVFAHIRQAVNTLWDDIQQVNGKFPFKHEHYLKIWELSDPALNADFILLDEAQDLSPIMRSVVTRQTGTQLVFVGDSNQQIYSFTGAVNAMKDLEGATRHLSVSFRFGPAIAAVANNVLAHLSSDLTITGAGADGVVGPINSPDVVLCRTNSGVVGEAFAALSGGLTPHVIGGVSELVRFCEAARELQNEGRTNHADLQVFDSWDAVLAHCADDDSDFGGFVKLIEKFGVEVLVARLNLCASNPAQADITISTAHKTKGMEWPTVRLAADFPRKLKNGVPYTPDPEELRLLYVAVTRAKIGLDTNNNDFCLP